MEMTTTKIKHQFKHKDMVYLLCDVEQSPRIVLHIILYPGDEIGYLVGANGDTSEHYEWELVPEKQVI
jgi:hypothetical protein